MAVAPLEGPGAALHLAEAAYRAEDYSGAVDGQLGQIQVRCHLAVLISSDPVL